MNNQCKNDGNLFNEWGVCELCGNTRQKQEAAAITAGTSATKNTEKFCIRCGAQLVDGNCPKCGGITVQPTPGPTIFTYAWDYIKSFFSSKPMIPAENSIRESANIWFVLAPALCLLTTLTLFCIGTFDMSDSYLGVDTFVMYIAAMLLMMLFPDLDISSKTEDKMETMYELLESKPQFFFSVLGIVIASFFALAGLRQLFFVISGSKPRFTNTLNFTAATLLPSGLTAAAGIIVALFSPFLAIVIMLIGSTLNYIYLYFGMQKAVRFTSSPFWKFIALIFADFIAICIVCLLFFWVFC